ncbi:MAG: glutathione S-transferase [Rhodospirillaceae bacterium]|nr:glutathione S-transferase [Rhodospirillaceae bacterium]
MLELYTWMTDNGYKARQMVEETGVDYDLKPINLRKKEQFDPEYLKISPGHKIPAIIDPQGPGGNKITLCESGAILKYLAEYYAPSLYPEDPTKRIIVDQWFIYGSAQWTTLAQQYGLFMHRLGEDVPRAQEHYDGVLRDMMNMYEKHLDENEYIAGDYSIADITVYPDVHGHGVKDIGLDEYPNIKRWHDSIEARPAVQRAWTPFA